MCRYIVAFTVGNEVNIEERRSPSEGATIDSVPNPILEKVGAAIDADERVRLRRVASVMRVGDRPRQQLLVWIEVFCGGSDYSMESTRQTVCEIVNGVIPSAHYSGIEDIDRDHGQLW